MNLYVLGNGFDKAHNLKTDYENFEFFLRKNDINCYLNCIKLIENYSKIHHNAITTNNLWKNFEENISNINVIEFPVDHDLRAILDLKRYFNQWVKSIDIKCLTKRKFLHDDYFLTFNYTEVLEKQYGINAEKICHIHGNQENPFFGGNVLGTIYLDENFNVFTKKSVKKAKVYVSEIYKNSGQRLEENIDFFMKSIKADKIIVFGHSLGFLDRIYFDFLSKNTSNNTEWIFYYFTEEDRKKAKETANSLKIKKYRIKKSEEFWNKEKP